MKGSIYLATCDFFLSFHTDISSAPLEGHSGSIQAALNLEFPHDKVKFFHIAIEGINGQLPNLDLVNTVFRLCRKERIPVALHTEVTDHVEHKSLLMYQRQLDSGQSVPVYL